MCVHYIRVCLVGRVEGVQYIGDIMIHVGDIISTWVGYHDSCEGANYQKHLT